MIAVCIFQMYGLMARDMRHPYIPSTTVLGDIVARARGMYM